MQACKRSCAFPHDTFHEVRLWSALSTGQDEEGYLHKRTYNRPDHTGSQTAPFFVKIGLVTQGRAEPALPYPWHFLQNTVWVPIFKTLPNFGRLHLACIETDVCK